MDRASEVIPAATGWRFGGVRALGEGGFEPVIAGRSHWVSQQRAQPLTIYGYLDHGLLHIERSQCSEQFTPVTEILGRAAAAG